MVDQWMLIKLFFSTGISFLISILIGPAIIPMLKVLKFGQSVRADGPESHLKKSGTPTMGGIIFIIAIVITAILFAPKRSDTFIILLSFIGFGLIGFLDDFIKIILKRSLGLRATYKIILQFVLAFIISIYALNTMAIGTKIYVPFIKEFVDLGVLYIPFIIFVIIGTVNTVNLTDGLDGLATSISLVVAIFFVFVSIFFRDPVLLVFSSSMVGGCLGFLRFNRYPAQVFMGDTGSFALGGIIVIMSIITRLPLILPIVGGIFVVEGLSVILQVTSFRLTGRRIFKMSPLHHHFELLGWHETKVVKVFTLVAVILGVIALLSL